MPNGVNSSQPLSSGDALFLYLEREGAPLNVAAICAFEGIIPLAACTEYIASKLPLIPRYRQRVVTPALNLGRPTWEDDPDFDVRHHVREVKLKNGTEAGFKAAVGPILSTTLPRERPLWDITLLHGLKERRTGVVFRVHHCLADGIAGIGLMNVILDSKKSPAPPRKGRDTFAAPPLKNSSLLGGVLDSGLATAERLLVGGAELLGMAQQLVAAAGQNGAGAAPVVSVPEVGMPPEDLRHLVLEFGSPTQRLPFNVVCSGPQKFGWAEVPLPELKAAKNACGATINDVVLAVLTSAIARYAARHGVALHNRFVRIIVPVNLRAGSDAGELGNRITFLPVNLPLDVRDLRELVAVVRASVARSRSARTPELVSWLGTLVESVPTPFQGVLGPFIGQLPLSLINTIITNVPGPQMPLYLLGHKMLSSYPYVPIGGEMGMNSAVLTYNGTAYFGFTGDAHAIPDLDKLEKFLLASFADLQKAAGIGVSRPKRAPRAARPAPRKAGAQAAPKAARRPAVRKSLNRPEQHDAKAAGIPEPTRRSKAKAAAARAGTPPAA